VVKVAWRHPEAEHEADGLRLWNGAGAVLLHESLVAANSIALLIERCVPGDALKDVVPEPEQDLIVAAAFRRLWVEPPLHHRLRPLQQMCHQWADGFDARLPAAEPTVDRGLAREAAQLFRTLPATAARTAVLCTDLHAQNILAAQREPWLVIDPKPYVGDPTYDVLQHMLNCEDRLVADPRALAQRLADLLELDADRLLLWLFARLVIDSIDRPVWGVVAQRIAPS